MADIGAVDAAYKVEVALKEPETAKPLRVEPTLVKDRVKGKPAAIVIE